MIYVLLLGWLQHRRFEQEAAAKGTSLHDVPGMLASALRLAVAAGLAIGVGLGGSYPIAETQVSDPTRGLES
jgi:hypothetical protein